MKNRIKVGFDLFQMEQLDHILIEIEENPELKHVKWKYGIDSDMMDSNVKRREVRNWLRYVKNLK